MIMLCCLVICLSILGILYPLSSGLFDLPDYLFGFGGWWVPGGSYANTMMFAGVQGRAFCWLVLVECSLGRYGFLLCE
jgi:hypothetical protein